MQRASTLLDELEATMRNGSGVQRAAILHRVTQLFLQHAESHRDEHIALFDDVMMRLIEQIEQQALIQLSSQLAPIANAPTKVVHHLASNNNIDVSRPILQKSPMLS